MPRPRGARRSTAPSGDKGTLKIQTQDQLEGFAAWVDALSVVGRSLLMVVFATGAVTCLVGGRLATLTDGWVAWVMRLVVLEPLGVLAILAADMVAYPRSRLSVYLSTALARRRYGSVAFIIVSLGAILEGLRWWVRQLVSSKPE